MFENHIIKYKYAIINIIMYSVYAYILNSIFHITINMWFIILWITLFVQIIFRILQKHNCKLKILIKIEELFIQIIIGLIISLFYN